MSSHDTSKHSPSQSSILAVIPARYPSTRFPGKPLADIQGKPMIQHVWERCRDVSAISRVIVATDDARIEQAVAAFGGEVRMTSPEHPSGTDRVWEVARGLPEYHLVLNVQGDEPFIEPQALEKAIQMMLETPDADIVTLVTPIREDEPEKRDNPNVVKAVLSNRNRALYFSRATMPYQRDPDTSAQRYHHLGIYLFRRNALEIYTQLPPSPLELTEKLEQLRALEAGMAIYAAIVDKAPVGIDTPEDLAKIKSSLK